MALDENDIETRTLALERKLNRLYAVVDDMVIFRMPRLEQQLTMLWSLPPRRVAQITGQVDGCADQGFPGATVRILNADGERLGTGVADSSGHYTAWANLESDPQTVTVEATPVGTYAARFDGPATDSVSVGVGENTAPTIVIPPTEDWCCGETDYFPGECDFAWTFNVRGCLSVDLAGATVELWQGGVLIDSCVTADGTGGTTLGQCILSVPGGTYDVVITGPTGAGFATTNLAGQTIAAAKMTNSTLTADSGHVCSTVCNYPVPKTLFTSDGLGTHTLTWNGSAWVGTATVSSGVKLIDSLFGACANGTVMTVTYTVNLALRISVGWKMNCCQTKNVGGAVIRIDYVYADDANGISTFTKTIGATGPTTVSSCSPVSATTNVATIGTVNFIDQHFCGSGGLSDTFPGFDTPGGGGMMAVTA